MSLKSEIEAALKTNNNKLLTMIFKTLNQRYQTTLTEFYEMVIEVEFISMKDFMDKIEINSE